MAAPRLPREAHAVAAQVAVCAAHGGGGGVLIASEQRVFPGDIVIVNGEQGRLVVAQMLNVEFGTGDTRSRSSSSHAMWLKP